MKSLRKIHLFLGCFFAPMLILFCLTGAAQMFGIRLGFLSEIHLGHRGSLLFILLAVLMGLSVIVTAILGIIMAFRMGGNKKSVWICLALGIVVPFLLLLMPGNGIGKKAVRRPPPNMPAQSQVVSNAASSTPP